MELQSCYEPLRAHYSIFLIEMAKRLQLVSIRKTKPYFSNAYRELYFTIFPTPWVLLLSVIGISEV